jgi:xanthine dehydrogenase accessory factor
VNQNRDVLSRAKLMLEDRQPVVLITVTGVRGSTPRERGARMLVDDKQQTGTIGGGELEYQAIAHARQLLEPHPSTRAEESQERQFVLGSNCGQCCGGVVTLSFQRLTRVPDWIEQEINSEQARATVAVFGAGHVGRAMVDVLAKLDVQIIWIDQREQQLVPQPSQPQAESLLLAPHPDPAAFAAQLPSGTLCLVMTHSHSLDFDICSQLLVRDDIPFCGLIGSSSKRRRFEGMLRQAGLGELTPRLTCPIGIDRVSGKTPYDIAVSVSAQLLQQIDANSVQASTPAKGALSAALPH